MRNRKLGSPKSIFEIWALRQVRSFGTFGDSVDCAGFGTFEDFDENLLWARSARHLTTHMSLYMPSSWLVGR